MATLTAAKPQSTRPRCGLPRAAGCSSRMPRCGARGAGCAAHRGRCASGWPRCPGADRRDLGSHADIPMDRCPGQERPGDVARSDLDASGPTASVGHAAFEGAADQEDSARPGGWLIRLRRSRFGSVPRSARPTGWSALQVDGMVVVTGCLSSRTRGYGESPALSGKHRRLVVAPESRLD